MPVRIISRDVRGGTTQTKRDAKGGSDEPNGSHQSCERGSAIARMNHLFWQSGRDPNDGSPMSGKPEIGASQPQGLSFF